MSAEIREPNTYWLLTWLESQKIRSLEQAAAALSNQSKLRELRDVANLWSESFETPPQGLSLVAGTGLRLDDDLSCPSPSCRRQQVDVLFRHAWHYFDQILLPDGVGHLLLDPPAEWSKEYVQDVLLNLIDIALYIHQLGADQLVSYYPSTTLQLPSSTEVLHEEDRMSR